ncbi:MAG: SRPBCC family protein [Gemmatimonadaceae bacterium]|nr:SRPBCC family protein [Gemmatimonadaceae bacterium]
MIGIVAGVAAAGIAAVLGLAARKPDEFRVRRTARIAAPPDRIFPLINDFHAWAQWSPWEPLDPAMARTHSGAPSGPGAVYEWNGNKKVGEGRMEITDAAAPRRVAIDLDFIRPFASSNVTEFTLEPDGDGTTVTWDMRGPNAFVSKVMGVFVNMDRLIGKDFENGLASMKAVAEQ